MNKKRLLDDLTIMAVLGLLCLVFLYGGHKLEQSEFGQYIQKEIETHYFNNLRPFPDK